MQLLPIRNCEARLKTMQLRHVVNLLKKPATVSFDWSPIVGVLLMSLFWFGVLKALKYLLQ